MSRRTIEKTKMDWQPVTQGKPSQGDRVLLKVEKDGELMHCVGYWGCGMWEVCTILMESESDWIEKDFDDLDVLAYAYYE